MDNFTLIQLGRPYDTYCPNTTNITISGYCPSLNDGIMCWPETESSTIITQACPSFFRVNGSAIRICWANGTWNGSTSNNSSSQDFKGFTNFTECIDQQEMEWIHTINKIKVMGYCISLLSLLLSLWIFCTFRSLRCIRIRIHIQLFMSFIFDNIMWIIWYEQIILDVNVVLSNTFWCQLHHLAKEYFMVANYMWMFCEALHLHLALVVVFVREEVTMKWFYAIGWGAAAIILIVHNLVRVFVNEDTQQCWMYEDAFSTWFLSIPIGISLLISLVFLINVLRVLLTIMHPNSSNPAPMGVRRAARAALILTPLFGLQYMLFPMRPHNEHVLYRTYIYAEMVFIPFQGVFCATLFCFANHDVHKAFGRYFRRSNQQNPWHQYFYKPTNDHSMGFCVACLFCFVNQEVHHVVKFFVYRNFCQRRITNGDYSNTGTTGGLYLVNGNTNNLELLTL